MKIYFVYSRSFKSKKLATEYHLKIFGDGNYQSSHVFNTKTKNIEKFKPTKKCIKEYLKQEKLLK